MSKQAHPLHLQALVADNLEAAYPWFKTSIGSRLKPRIRKVYQTWAGFADDELIPHLHRIVSTL